MQLQGNDILVNCEGNMIHSKNVYLFTKSIIIRGSYILTRNYNHFKEPYICSVKEIYPRSMKTYSFREVISIQGNMFYLRNIYSFKFKAIRGIAEIFIQKLSPAAL